MNIGIRRWIIMVLFIVIAIGLSFFFYHDVRPTGLLTYLPISKEQGAVFDHLLPIKPFTYQFTADRNNLGIVEVRFRSLKRIEDYNVLFRIKNAGESNWFYEHVYYFNPFLQDTLYPFGFPVIPDSKGKQFEIEISAIGNKDVPMVISQQYPTIVAKYQVPFSVLKAQGNMLLLAFIKEKIVTTVTNRDFLLNLVFLFFPLGFLIPILYKRKVDVVVMVGVLLNSITFGSLKLIHIESDISYVFGGIMLLYLIILGELRTSHVLKMALVFFIGAVIAVLTNTTVVAERFAIWTYVLGIVAVTGSSISGRKKESADIPRVEQYIFRIGLVVIICLALGVSVYQIGSYGRKILLPRSANNTTVSYVGPSKNYTQGSGITQGFEIIRGTGFGDRYDGSIHLMSDYGEIEEYSWSDTMIVFRIPTYWKVGKTNIWIGKNTKDSALIDVPVSGVYTISILDRSTAWDVTDDAYYRELLSAPGVVREVNGYTRGWYY